MTMPRFQRRMALRPINRIKHVVDSNSLLSAGVNLPTTIALATDTPTLAVTTSVETGSKINGFYLKVELASNETVAAAIPNVYLIIWKNPGGNLTAPQPNTVGSNDNKRFVIHQEMVLMNNAVAGQPRTLFNGVVVIPKGMRRFGPNDKLEMVVRSNAVDMNFCMQAHYKEFR